MHVREQGCHSLLPLACVLGAERRIDLHVDFSRQCYEAFVCRPGLKGLRGVQASQHPYLKCLVGVQFLVLTKRGELISHILFAEALDRPMVLNACLLAGVAILRHPAYTVEDLAEDIIILVLGFIDLTPPVHKDGAWDERGARERTA